MGLLADEGAHVTFDDEGAVTVDDFRCASSYVLDQAVPGADQLPPVDVADAGDVVGDHLGIGDNSPSGLAGADTLGHRRRQRRAAQRRS